MSDLRPTQGVSLALFADDLAIMYKHKKAIYVHKHLNNAMKDISNWYTKWRLPVNSDKSQSVYFIKSVAITKPFEKVYYKENTIEWTNQAKYFDSHSHSTSMIKLKQQTLSNTNSIH